MREFEVDGEEKLILAAKYLVKELRYGKSLTKNAKTVLGDLLSELSRVVISEDRDEGVEIRVIEHRLNAVCEKIKIREVDESKIWDLGSDEGNEYLDDVNELRVLIYRLNGSLRFGKSGTEEISLKKARNVLQTAMVRLEVEFKHLLVEHRLPLLVEEGTMMVDLIKPDVISDLKNITHTMIASGYDRQCIQVCTMVRKEALDEFLYNQKVEKLSIEEVLSMDWAVLDSNIEKWVRVMRNLVKIYFVSEKSLDNQIFGDLNKTGLTCFVDTVKGTMMQFLNFFEAVSLGPRKPEKLPRILEMYKLASEILPIIEALFSDHPGSSVRRFRRVMRRLGDCARTTFLEFKSVIASDVSSHPSGGSVHPLTNYVMNFLMTLTYFSQTLDLLLKEHGDEENLTVQTSRDIINPVMIEEESTYENSFFQSITSILEANLEEKSKQYKNISQRHFSLLNNIHYMLQKVLNSELRHIFGDEWNRKYTWKFQQQVIEYERATWLHVLSFLKDDSSGSDSRSLTPRERFQGFDTAFEEVYKTQIGWLISDEMLREDLRTKASTLVIQAYRSFYARYKHRVSDKYIKYSSDDLERLFWDLFADSPKSSSSSHT